MARALATLLVTLAFLALARLLTILAPAIWVARALACYIITLAIRVTHTFAFAVWTPELGRTLYGRRERFLFNHDEYIKLLKNSKNQNRKTNVVRVCKLEPGTVLDTSTMLPRYIL